MIVEIGGKKIHLVKEDVRIAKRITRNFLNSAKTHAEEHGARTFYYTLLCVMYIMSHDLIESLTPETLALILNARAESAKKSDTKKSH